MGLSCRYVGYKHQFPISLCRNRDINFLSTLSPVTFTPSHITKCSEKLWSVWPLSAFQPSMLIQSSKNAMELTVMITDMPLQLHLMAMVSLLHLIVHPLLPMESQLPHTANLLQHMEPTKQLYQT